MDLKATLLRNRLVKRARRALRRRREAANRAFIARHAPAVTRLTAPSNANLLTSHDFREGVEALRGVTAGGQRILAALDKAALAVTPVAHVAFHAMPADAAGSPLPAIASVTIVARGERTRFGRRRERRISPVARNLRVPAGGFFFRFPVAAEWRAALQAAAIRGRNDPQVSFHLAIEFAGPGRGSLAALSIGAEPVYALAGDAGLEDPNVAAQVRLIKGLGDWEDRPLAAGPPRQASAAPDVEIVICVHDALDETLVCLDSLGRSAGAPLAITLVDDGSTTETVAALRARAAATPGLSLIELGEQRGYTRAANIGLRAAAAEWIVLLNSDTIVPRDWLAGLTEAAMRAKADFVGPVSNAASWQSVPDIRDAAGGWKVNPLPEGHSVDSLAAVIAELSTHRAPEVPLLNGFCMLMRRRTLAALGYLDEASFPMGYGEETDLCLRARAAGYRLAIADDVYVHHVKSASFGGRRAALTKQGNERLKAKHPGADLDALQRQMAEIEALAELRRRLRGRLVAEPAGILP